MTILLARPVDQLRDLYTRFGIAACYAQQLETLLIAVLKASARVGEPELATSDLDSLDTVLSRLTLGQLISRVRAAVPLEPQIEMMLSEALTKRNYLMHHYFGHNAHRMLSAEGRVLCVSELKSLTDHLTTTLAALWPLLEQFFRKIGWSNEDVQRGLLFLQQTLIPEGPDIFD